MLINMTASIEEINKSLDYATNFFSGDTSKMHDETKSSDMVAKYAHLSSEHLKTYVDK